MRIYLISFDVSARLRSQQEQDDAKWNLRPASSRAVYPRIFSSTAAPTAQPRVIVIRVCRQANEAQIMPPCTRGRVHFPREFILPAPSWCFVCSRVSHSITHRSIFVSSAVTWPWLLSNGCAELGSHAKKISPPPSSIFPRSSIRLRSHGLSTRSRTAATQSALDYGYEDGPFSLLSATSVTIFNPVSLFSSAVIFWIKLKAVLRIIDENFIICDVFFFQWSTVFHLQRRSRLIYLKLWTYVECDTDTDDSTFKKRYHSGRNPIQRHYFLKNSKCSPNWYRDRFEVLIFLLMGELSSSKLSSPYEFHSSWKISLKTCFPYSAIETIPITVKQFLNWEPKALVIWQKLVYLKITRCSQPCWLKSSYK